MKQLTDYRKWADPLLKDKLSSAADDSVEKLHLSLAMLDQDQQQVDYLYRQLLRTESQRFPVISDALAKHQEPLREPLWKVVNGRLGKSDEAKESLAKYLATNLEASVQAYVRIQVPAWLGESAQASTALESSATALGANSDDLYNVACAAALSSQAFATRDPAQSLHFADRAMELLQQIVAKGSTLIPQMKSDADFASLHGNPRFSALLATIEPTAKYATVVSSDTKLESKLLAAVPVDSATEQLKPLLVQGWRPVAMAVDSNVPLTLRREDAAKTAITTERDEYNRTCSLLLHRPVIPNDSILNLAKRQAVSAIALLRQGEREKIFSALRVTDDPESLTQFVHRCRARRVSTGELWECVRFGVDLRRDRIESKPPVLYLGKLTFNLAIQSVSNWDSRKLLICAVVASPQVPA